MNFQYKEMVIKVTKSQICDVRWSVIHVESCSVGYSGVRLEMCRSRFFSNRLIVH